MKSRKFWRRILTITMTLFLMPVVGSWALFQDRAYQENNTFSTGDTALKLYYDCQSDGFAQGLDEQTYTSADSDSLLAEEIGAVVNCGQGNDLGAGERLALHYGDAQDGATYLPTGQVFNRELDGVNGDWSSTNNWFDVLSSVIDYTSLTPGFKTYLGASPTLNEGNMVTIGNAGTSKLADVMLNASYELVDTAEAQEPLDGEAVGGASVDPLLDEDWVNQVGRAYDTSLGNVINVVVERVTPEEEVLETVFTGTFDDLVQAGAVTIFPDTHEGLEANQVTYLRLNWSLGSNVDSSYQNKVFDYQLSFDSV